ncbi:TIGR02611 family protein [Aquipuribacter sp. MA13-6]|uniref:TIGR02611 family protein n=1 Tax=unclassified Aquipuribacter TaxID=2635084 RepID=UPI003EE96060
MEPDVQHTVGGDPPVPERSREAERAHRSRRAWRRLRARTRAVRARVRRTPAGRLGWRIGVGVVGGLLLVAGIIMIPGPGQGWATVFLALAILSTEFSWAQRLRHGLWVKLVDARHQYSRQSPQARVLIMTTLTVAVLAVLAGVFWASLAVTGLPEWLPSTAEDLLDRLPGVN